MKVCARIALKSWSAPVDLPLGTMETTLEEKAPLPEQSKSWRLVGISTFLFALLQALCPAVIALSAVRVAIGLGALTVAVVGTDAPAEGFHADLIRIPMMVIAFAGSLLNLFVIWHVRRLRKRPAAQWRLSPVPKSKLRSERLQIALAVLTFVLLAAEWFTHPMIHHPPH